MKPTANSLKRGHGKLLWYLLLVSIVAFYELSSNKLSNLSMNYATLQMVTPLIQSTKSSIDSMPGARLIYRGLPNTISCADVQQHIDDKTWPDPNRGSFFIRRIIDPPYFYASAHIRAYDPLRYKHVFENGRYYEEQVIKRFNKILSDEIHRNSIVLDVGANIGYYTLLSASYQNTVYAFEINPANLIRLCESLSLNRWADNGHVHLYQRAVSRQSGDPLKIPIPRNPGAASILGGAEAAVNESTTTRSIATTTVALDDLARENGWLDDPTISIALLKVDVEGAESLVMEGAKALLKARVIKNILTEVRKPTSQATRESMTTLLDSGYRIVKDDVAGNATSEIQRLSRDETMAHMKYIEANVGLRGRPVYADLWFQLEE